LSEQQTGAPSWPRGIHELLLAQSVRQVAYVPDAGHSELIKLCQASEQMATISLTTEEEGISMLAGAWLGGERGVLLMQSSGVGNCVNLFGMVQECRFPLLMLITMRGQWGEFNPWQVWMGSASRTILEQCGVVCYDVDEPQRVVETVAAASNLVFNAYRSVAVLIGQRVIGSKNFSK
jgi:sulfopyruvate decarboxylase alpha subunit